MPVQCNYQVVSRAAIAETTEVAPPPTRPDGAPELRELPDVKRDAVQKREERALQRAQEERAKINESVTVRDQAVFSALSKTMPCEWMRNDQVHTILVMGAVRRRLGPAERRAASAFDADGVRRRKCRTRS